MPGMLVVTRMFCVSGMSGGTRVSVDLGRCIQGCTGGMGMGDVSSLSLIVVVLPLVISPAVRMRVIMSHVKQLQSVATHLLR